MWLLLGSVPAQHAKMTTSPDLGEHRGFRGPLTRTSGLAHGVRQREQVVMAGTDLDEVGREPHDLPAPRRGQSLRVLGAQVVGVGFGQVRERAEHRGGVRVDVRERSHGSGLAGRTRALSDGSHPTRLPARSARERRARAADPITL